MRIYSVALIVFFFTLLAGCKQAVQPEQLYGRWNYIKVENPHQNPPLILTDEEIKIASPYISFDQKRNLKIIWAGKVLSHGTFKMDGMMIRFSEVLEGGAVREFPFLIKEISDKKIVFQTMNEDPTLVTALKIN